MSEEDRYRLSYFPTYQDKLERVKDLLVYAGQDPEQALIPDGLLKDARVILDHWVDLQEQIDRLADFIMAEIPAEFKAIVGE